MRRILALGIGVLASILAQQPALAAEGPVTELQAQPLDPQRVSKYTGTRGAEAPPAQKSAKTHSVREQDCPAEIGAAREADDVGEAVGLLVLRRRQHAARRSRRDGFHREFRVRFDADVVSGNAIVFARLYLRRVGDRDWLLYHETEDFQIFGEDGDDDYFVTTTLDDGWPTGDYDVLIDLYESGFSDIVATLGPFDDGSLALLPLEEAGLDLPIELPGYTIHEVSTTLIIDDDSDGHYSKFRVEFDPDADFDGTFVFAEVWVRAQGGEWIQEHVSDDFLVDASGDADVYSLTADWISGYPTAFYDVQIDLRDADTGALVASAGSERPELSRIPLEDQGRDTRISLPPSNGAGGGVTSREHGGGAIGGWFALSLLMLLVWAG